jgi:hypothetical protein
MDLEIYAGTAFRAKNQAGEDTRRHLNIVLSNPAGNPAEVLLVNLTSRLYQVSTPYEDNDTSCLVYPGDHPFVTKESFVFYARANIVAVEPLQSLLKIGKAHFEEDCSDVLLLRIWEGLRKSDYVPPIVLRYGEKNFPNYLKSDES